MQKRLDPRSSPGTVSSGWLAQLSGPLPVAGLLRVCKVPLAGRHENRTVSSGEHMPRSESSRQHSPWSSVEIASLRHGRPDYMPVEMEEVHEMLLNDDEMPPPTNLHEPRILKKSRRTDVPPNRSLWPHLLPASRSVLLTISLLFAVDSFAFGLVPVSWIVFYFNRQSSYYLKVSWEIFSFSPILQHQSHISCRPPSRNALA